MCHSFFASVLSLTYLTLRNTEDGFMPDEWSGGCTIPRMKEEKRTLRGVKGYAYINQVNVMN